MLLELLKIVIKILNMEDSKKNKERKVLTDEELEQVSGGQSNYGPVCSNQPKDVCLSVGCYWSDKSNRCYNDEAEANLYESGKSARRRPIFDINTA